MCPGSGNHKIIVMTMHFPIGFQIVKNFLLIGIRAKLQVKISHTLPKQSPGQSLPAISNTSLLKSTKIQSFQKSVNSLLSIKIMIFQKLSYMRFFFKKKTAILTLSSSTAASWQLCIFRRRIFLLGMLFYAGLYAVIYAAIFLK